MIGFENDGLVARPADGAQGGSHSLGGSQRHGYSPIGVDAVLVHFLIVVCYRSAQIEPSHRHRVLIQFVVRGFRRCRWLRGIRCDATKQGLDGRRRRLGQRCGAVRCGFGDAGEGRAGEREAYPQGRRFVRKALRQIHCPMLLTHVSVDK